VEVKVLNVDTRKLQIKLSMKALEEQPVKEVKEKDFRPAKTSEPAPVMEEEAREEPIPTAMEMALREAMERSKDKQPAEPVSKGKRKPKGASNELEQILYRTLHNKRK
jgi:predicted RNA-binding protein with RPS1 domain